MKHIPTHLLPAIALLALGGCATTGGLTTTEPDGVYYSSKDRTTEVAPVASANQSAEYAATDDPNAVANPDYQDGRSKSRGTASDEYYDDDFDYSYYARTRRYNGLGMGYSLSYVDPYWYRPTFIYNDPFFYSPYGYGYSYSPWYDPFWGPSYGGVSISIGWGLGGWGPWGPYGGYYGRPWGYGGYGWGGYNRGYWDGYYSGVYSGGYWDGYRGGSRAVNYRVGHRNNRSVEVVGAANGGGRPRVTEATGGRMTTDNGAVGSPDRYRRGRIAESPAQPQPGQVMADQPVKEPGRGRLYRIQETEANPGVSYPAGTVKPQQNASEMAEQPTRYQRGRFNEANQPSQATQPTENPGQVYQPQRRQRYVEYGGQQPQQAEPTRRERVYESPAPTRSYEQPSRSSYGGGNSGGGSSSGGSNSGGGGGGRGRVR
ncbi:hypothetical protein LJ737_01770 [Hymenobacter sp. 15J16-1T3B]|uniref:hypothetical protein n=1 Tax=Hymenobacter sp. 15J16-1T3B TaxID=2886941 RepID=UPI001D106E4A|nr:hypothetical protein [Hymenobacter sp. 15J16-1T3B]MCC3155947.1 hypothetical protein [Hymenobacter sp. 15J16-1T3B]